MDRKQKLIRQAIESAERELKEINEKIGPLLERKGKLQAFISQGKILVGNEKRHVTEMITAPDRTRKGFPSKEHPVWAGAREVLAEAKRPMTAGEITTELMNRGWKLSKKWGMEVVRAGMGRKLEVFERLGEGWYALKEWPDHFKKVPGPEVRS